MTYNKTTYKRLGDYIREVDVRNTDLRCSNLLGLSNAKVFIPSIANTIGTDLRSYKIVRQSQFAYVPVTSRNGDKITVALYNEEQDCIVSQAYLVFEVINHEKLLPEYLMMWFRRLEFDRYARFKSHGSAREVFEWDEMCDVMLPVPSIEEQRRIVTRYQAIQNRIENNKKTIAKLEEAAQALYRKMFVDDIDVERLPEGWRMGTLGEIADIIDGDRGSNYPKYEDFSEKGYCLFLNAGNVTKNGFSFEVNSYISKEKSDSLRKGLLKRYDLILTTRGTVGNIAYYSDIIEYDVIRINSGMVIIRERHRGSAIYIYSFMSSSVFKNALLNNISGSAQPQLPISDLSRITILVPSEKAINDFSEKADNVYSLSEYVKKENRVLTEMLSLLMVGMGR